MAPSASAARLIVDDTPVQCPNAGPLAAAVAAANATPEPDTIAICPGTYSTDAPIAVTAPLTLWAAGADAVRIEPSATFTGGHVFQASGAGPFQIAGVTIAGGGADGAASYQDVGGWLERSRLTDLGSGHGVTVTSTTARADVQVLGTLIEGYDEYGVRFESAGSPSEGNVTDSVVRAAGPVTGASAKRDGVQVAGAGATAHIQDNLISGNRNLGDEAGGAGVRLIDANEATTIKRNDLQGNGYGVFRTDASELCDDATTTADIDATNNWWGADATPTRADRPSIGGGCPGLPGPGTPSATDKVNSGVDVDPWATTPFGAPTVPAPQTDEQPSVSISSPADGTEAAPGSNVTVEATASDDFDIAKVEFRRGAALVATDTTPPYSAAVESPAAGASQAVTATAFDSSGQTAVAAISLRGKTPPADPATPQQPSEPEDRPPSVAITGPGEGTAISPSAPPRITADAADDRGVARVAFLDDGKVICTDDVAPYDCAYTPTGDDVGRDTLIAIAVDGAGQTAVAFRGVTVQRFDPKLTARTTPGRDRKRPYRYTTTGSVLLPAGVTPEQACTAGGSVSIEFRVGKLRLPQTAALRPDCSFRTSIAFPSKRSLGNGRIAVSAKFGGNVVLGTAKAASQKVRAG